MVVKCVHLEEFMEEQGTVLARHLDKHKWYRKIADPNKALLDFIERYGWIMREMYCGHCPEKEGCEAYDSYLERNGLPKTIGAQI